MEIKNLENSVKDLIETVQAVKAISSNPLLTDEYREALKSKVVEADILTQKISKLLAS